MLITDSLCKEQLNYAIYRIVLNLNIYIYINLYLKIISLNSSLLLTLQETLLDATFTLFFQSHTFTIMSC